MRVLDTTTGRFVDIPSDGSIPFAILSHTWDAGGEQSYQDVCRIQDSLDTRPRELLRKAGTALLWLLCLFLSSFLRLLASVVDSGHLTFSLLLHVRANTRAWVAAQLLMWSNSLMETTRDLALRLSVLHDLRLSEKIRRVCAVAHADGFGLIWIDSACIDKTSSSELSEAINSMYAWYRDAAICYAYLADVPLEEDPNAPCSLFRQSRWFTRGWTLQELIAPVEVAFLSRDWEFLGSRTGLAVLLQDITNVARDMLVHKKSVDEFSVAQRMSWAARRETTRLEDRAYSLLGIFDISMAPLYGEGQQAFFRLQLEILRRIPDESIFAWRVPDGRQDVPHLYLKTGIPGYRYYFFQEAGQPLLPPSPSEFANRGHIRAIPHDELLRRLSIACGSEMSEIPQKEYNPTPYGIRTHFPTIYLGRSEKRIVSLERQCFPAHDWYYVVLACERSDIEDAHLLAQPCYAPLSSSGSFLLAKNEGNLVQLSLEALTRYRKHLKVHTIYLSYSGRARPSYLHLRIDPCSPTVKVTVPRWVRSTLESEQYSIRWIGQTDNEWTGIVQPGRFYRQGHPERGLHLEITKNWFKARDRKSVV